MKRAVCIHGHFYQPPRENPGLGIVEPQPSAAPFADWNERITAECYARNGKARVLDGNGALAKIVNNYASISFDFGPTLTRWLDRHHPDVVASIAEGDRRFGGAIAHPLHHVILPLSDPRDRNTEIRLGLDEFQRRFKRRARGFWLPETAADIATLEALADHHVEFTVLAPRQAARVRASLRGADAPWQMTPHGAIDTRLPYLVRLPSGRSISVFFYDGPLSQAIAFEHLLDSADSFAARIVAAFDSKATRPQLVTICTDGETYGHHHRFGEMALARTLEILHDDHGIEVTTFERFLDANPPVAEAEIVSPSAWSCAHGVERWRSDCGCRIGAPGSSQAWRTPLRTALEHLRRETAAVFEDEMRGKLRDPWAARDDAFALFATVPDESEVSAFLERHRERELSAVERTTVLEALEAQRQSLAMFTSCAWFFDDVGGIETLQVLAHADRVLELTQRVTGRDLTAPFLEILERAESNDRSEGSAATLHRVEVRPLRGDPFRIAKHAALVELQANLDSERSDEGITSPEREWVAGHRIAIEHARHLREGEARMASGSVLISCPLGGREFEFTFAAIETEPLEFAVCVIDGDDRHLLRRIEDDFLRDPVAARKQLEQRAGGCSAQLCALLPFARERFVRASLEPLMREERAARRRVLAAVERRADEIAAGAIALPGETRRAREAEIESNVLESLAKGRLDATTLEAMRGIDIADERVLARLGVWLAETTRLALAPRDDGAQLRSLRRILETAFRAVPTLDREPLQAEVLRVVDSLLPEAWGKAPLDREARSWIDALLALARYLGVKATP